jgi:uncharacterized membrane protein
VTQLTHAPAGAINMHWIDRCASLVGGGLLAAAAIRGRSPRRILIPLGAELLRRGITGHCYAYQTLGVRTASPNGRSVSVPYELGEPVSAAVTINRPRGEIYRFWRDFSNLPKVMKNLVSVDVHPDGRSHWVALGPGSQTVQWDAEIHNDLENERIAWRSLPGSQIQSAGSVQFKDAPGNRGTEVLVRMQYNPPAGFFGAKAAKLLGSDAETEIEADLFRLKQYFESGEIATTDGQPKGAAKHSKVAMFRGAPQKEVVA